MGAMKKILYHGSENIIEKPIYGAGKSNNDYGRGFYCTEDINLASEWAVEQSRDGYVNKYSIDTKGMYVINLNSGDYTILHWLSVLISNRTFELTTPLMREAFRFLGEVYNVELSDADIVIGYRADDSYFSFAQDFLLGQISLSQLSRALRLGNLGEQVMIKSRRAFDALKFSESIAVASREWYVKKRNRDDLARSQYRKMNKKDYIRGDLYMTRILDEEVKTDDPRLQ
jgi:hypothetical protein